MRVLAIFGVISLHVFMRWPDAKVMGILIISFSEIIRFGVPIFLMLSGALLLNRKMSIKDFFKRRFPRLIKPFILYLIVYSVVLIFLIHNFNGFDELNKFLSYIPLGYNWYFWMILGIYFSIPVIDIFIRNSKLSDIEYFLIILLIGSLFYQLVLFFDISSYINLNFFISPLSYIILGYYLSIKKFKMSPNKLILICISLFIITTIIKMGGLNHVIPYNLAFNYEASRSPVVRSFLDLGFLEFIQAGSFFLIFRYTYQYLTQERSILKKLLYNKWLLRFNESVSKSSYGMYLFHHTLIEPLIVIAPLFTLTGTQTFICIILLSFLTFLICWLVVLIFNKIPIIKEFSGYH